MLKFKTFIIALILPFGFIVAQQDTTNYSYKFRVFLSDKNASPYSIDNPLEFLSQKALDRRNRQNIAIDESDLPVSPQYVEILKSQGFEIAAKSKWLNTVTVHCNDSIMAETLNNFAFVDSITFVWKGIANSIRMPQNSNLPKSTTYTGDYYGAANKQILVHRGDSLHRAGFRSEGMDIAVLDAGFEHLDENLYLSDVQIQEIKDFVFYKDSSLENDHGVKVLSCMATNHPYTFVGTAPKARYWLLRTENAAYEYPVEEDYWVTAAEYADSIGVDVINSSLGYSKFDAPATSYTYEQTDGKTAYITQGANKAVEKGIFVVSSAGNEGSKNWKYITPPADGQYVFTVGAMKSDSIIIGFSSRGPTADGRVKPDVMAVGSQAGTIDKNGIITTSSGTSFSSPIMCGLVTCLWQAFPLLTNKQLADVIRQSANRYYEPDNNYGYGIPNMVKAMQIANSQTGINNTIRYEDYFNIITDSVNQTITIKKTSDNSSKYNVRIYSIEGKTITIDSFHEKEKTYKIAQGNNNIFIINIKSSEFAASKKVCF
ncbi:serine protease [Dysgonomonas sp. 216]|uniref:S8 family serine peptidase n=1 Tax=Dysgonomonas sp. 216 TaxID=2302934 RepID=UPI0013D10B5F|nr:S8 family serine peptidase [Dysgonomonas sp. 216]NDW18435.1 serine protease [Dysgonomonas sp. 216]